MATQTPTAWTNPNVAPPSPNQQVNNPNQQRTPEEQAVLDQLSPLLPELDDEMVGELDELNQDYESEYERAESDYAARRRQELLAQGNLSRSQVTHHINLELDSPRVQGRLHSTVIHSMGGRIDVLASEFIKPLTIHQTIDQDRVDAIYEALHAVAQMPRHEWAGSQDDDGQWHYNGAIHVLDSHVNPSLYATSAPSNPNALQNPGTERDRLLDHIDVLHEQVELLLEIKREAAVARQRGLMFEKEGLQERYETKLVRYTSKLKELLEAVRELGELDGRSDDDIKEAVEKVTNELEEPEAKAEKDLAVEKGRFIGRSMERYANLKGWKRVVASVAIGGVVASTVALGTTLLPFAGGAAAIAGVAAVTRFARGYALGLSKRFKEPVNFEAFVAHAQADIQETIDNALAFIKNNGQERIEATDKVRRKALLGAMATVALGAAAAPLVDAMDTDINIKNPFKKELPQFNKPEVEIKKPSITEDIGKLAEGNDKLKGLLAEHMDSDGNLEIPLKKGDGLQRIADRYGLTDAQQAKLTEILQSHNGQTYMKDGDVRINFGTSKHPETFGKMQLSAKELMTILNTK